MLALFTHQHIFWVAGLLLALVDLPDFGTPLRRIAGSVESMAGLRLAKGQQLPTRWNEPASPMTSTDSRWRMLELILCSLLTILPDYLYRRYRQGKRIGHEITLYSVWFELRWGIVGCLMLTVGLDHDDLLFPSVHKFRHVTVPDQCPSFLRRMGASLKSS